MVINSAIFQEYEMRIETLQRQVDLAQSMISSTCSTWDGERFLTSSLINFGKFIKYNFFLKLFHE